MSSSCGRALRVVVEQLVEVAHAVEHQHVRVVGLDAEVLAHHRRMHGTDVCAHRVDLPADTSMDAYVPRGHMHGRRVAAMKILHVETGRHLYGGPQQVLYLMRGLTTAATIAGLPAGLGRSIRRPRETAPEVIEPVLRGRSRPAVRLPADQYINDDKPDPRALSQPPRRGRARRPRGEASRTCPPSCRGASTIPRCA